MIFPSRSQLASKQITRTGRAESVTKEGLAATLLLARQPDRMGQRHPLRPVRPRSRPGPLPYVVFQHQCGRYPYYGQRGRISAREVYDQLSACSCLTLILACIVYWQAREISRIAAAPDFPFDPDLLRHVSPIEWKNVILYGEIKIDPAKLKMRQP